MSGFDSAAATAISDAAGDGPAADGSGDLLGDLVYGRAAAWIGGSADVVVRPVTERAPEPAVGTPGRAPDGRVQTVAQRMAAHETSPPASTLDITV